MLHSPTASEPTRPGGEKAVSPGQYLKKKGLMLYNLCTIKFTACLFRMVKNVNIHGNKCSSKGKAKDVVNADERVSEDPHGVGNAYLGFHTAG